MRRKDREVTDMQEIETMLRAQSVCRLALNGDGYPYIIPMNYGVVRNCDRFSLYFHCAHEGEKLRLMQKDPRASFEVDGEHHIFGGEAACTYTFRYASVIGQGKLSVVTGSEKETGLLAIMQQLVPERTFTFDDAALSIVTVLRLDIERMTAKRNRRTEHDG